MLNKIIDTLVLLFLFSSATFTIIAQNDKALVKDSTNKSTTSKELVKNLTVPAGTKFTVTINTQLATNRNVAGSTFSASLAADLKLDTIVVSPKNSQVIGKIVESKSGQGLGDAKLSIQITEITVNNQLIPVVTNPINVKGGRKRDSAAEIPAGTIEEVSLTQPLIIK
jgi:hypothetical protein